MVETDGPDVTACERCPALVESRSRIVNGVGPDDAALLFVGEAPGANEDEQGEPFVGRSGSILDDALRDAGLGRSDVRITNCVRCRPPENRDPKSEEISECFPYLQSELELINPDVVVALGKVPASTLLERTVAVTKEAGAIETQTYGNVTTDVVICPHPAATLYNSSYK